MSAPLVVTTTDGMVWLRRASTRGGLALYAPASVCSCPEFVMATEAELAEHGIAGTADVLPVPVGSEPQDDPIAAGRSLDLLALMDERVASKVSPVLAAVLDEAESLRARVAELEAERHVTNEALDDAVQELRTSYAERAQRETHPGRRQAWRMLAQAEESERVANALLTPEASRSADKLTALLAPTQALQEGEPAAKCRCDEPDADPYACEAEDCTGEFSELNPFGGGPVQGHDAKVSRTCRCGWHTSEWHVADGSAEEELHGHVTSVHGGVYPQKAGA